MRCEIVDKLPNGNIVLQLHDELDYKTLADNTHKGRIFCYLDPWIKGTTTDEQRKHYWSLIGDISEHTGDPKWIISMRMKYIYMTEYEATKEPSLAINKMKKEDAAKLIQVVIDYCLSNDIPFRKDRFYLTADYQKTLFGMTMKRLCLVCGKPNSDIHHATNLVGMGNKRSKHNHVESSFLSLCREHHNQAHSMGLDEFCQLHHLEPVKLSQENLKELGVS